MSPLGQRIASAEALMQMPMASSLCKKTQWAAWGRAQSSARARALLRVMLQPAPARLPTATSATRTAQGPSCSVPKCMLPCRTTQGAAWGRAQSSAQPQSDRAYVEMVLLVPLRLAASTGATRTARRSPRKAAWLAPWGTRQWAPQQAAHWSAQVGWSRRVPTLATAGGGGSSGLRRLGGARASRPGRLSLV